MCDLSEINCFIPHCDEGTQTSLCVIQSTGEMLSQAKNKTPPFTCFKFSWVNWPLSWQEPWPSSFLFIYLVRGHSDIVHWWIINRDAINPATLVPLLSHYVISLQHNITRFTLCLVVFVDLHICIWWCFQAEFKVRSLQITRKVTTMLFWRMTPGI